MSPHPNAALFTNPYKTMQSGVLASLDKYMKEDSYWEDSTYKKELLEAGQYEKRQYIIPVSFVITLYSVNLQTVNR